MNKQENKSSLTGLILIGIIFVLYPILFPFNTEITEEKKKEIVEKQEEIADKNSKPKLTKYEAESQEINDVKDSIQIISEEFFYLENDKIKITFTNKGGEIKSAVIKGYYTYNDYKNKLDDNQYESKYIEIFNNQDSRFKLTYFTDITTISTDVFFTAEKSVDGKSITFRKDYQNGSFMQYIYTLNNNENFVDLTIKSQGITNQILEWTIAAPETEKSKKNQEQYTGFYYQENGSRDVDYTWDTDINKNNGFEKNEFDSELSWVAFTQQFFSTIIETKENNFSSNTELKVITNENDQYVKRLSLRTALQDGQNKYSIYFGENNYKKLKKYNKDFEEIIPLGWGIFGWVNKVIVINLFDYLKNSAGLTNFGLIILILTLIIKISLSPLTYKSYLSQAKMKVLKPEIDKINEKHKTKDPMKAQQETMGLYRKAGVNPLGGCLPMLIQFPILIAMFRFFPSSIELRQKSFLWADDLSAYDQIASLPFHIPFYGDHVSLFTLLMTISTLIYTHMNSQMTSNQMPGMKTMMYLMPVMFLGFFISFASSLSYYYFLANVFTFSQMYLMRRFVDDEKIFAQLEANKKKPKKKSKFQKKLEEIQKKQEAQLKKRKRR